MPELPDVEIFRRYFNRTALNKKVVNVDVADDEILENMSSRSFQMRMKGETFQATHRHGKYLFIELDREETLMMHFGMTGSLKYYKKEDEKPEHSRVIFNLGNGYKLSFVCPRKLAKIALIEDEADFIEEHELGPDPYSDDFKWKDFKEIMSGKRGSIKTTLMDQKVLAGIGNVYSDEILYHSKIYPFIKVDELSEKKLKTIFEKMKWVFDKAIEAKVEEDNFPDNFLILKRSDGEKCALCGGKIKKEKYSGRSSYFCENHQSK
ncbi:MAG: DNA-formamidopyrimidine glycosylase [Bacteroidota bacterium]